MLLSQTFPESDWYIKLKAYSTLSLRGLASYLLTVESEMQEQLRSLFCWFYGKQF